MCAAVGELTFHGAQTAYQVRENAKEGFAEEKTRLEALAKRQANNDANLIVLGERHRPALYTKIGVDQHDRQIAITAETPEIWATPGQANHT